MSECVSGEYVLYRYDSGLLIHSDRTNSMRLGKQDATSVDVFRLGCRRYTPARCIFFSNTTSITGTSRAHARHSSDTRSSLDSRGSLPGWKRSTLTRFHDLSN